MSNDVSTLWWDQITGPKSLVSEVSDTLQNADSLILYAPDDLPWRREMRNAVERKIRGVDDHFYIYYIDCQTDCEIKEDGTIDVADFLIQRFAPSPEIRTGYRKTLGSKAEYIVKNEILRNQIVWIKGMTSSQVKCWVDFCEKWKGADKYDGLFVIECYGLSPSEKIKNLKRIECSKHVMYYDSLLFDNMVVAGLNLILPEKQYIASLAAQLCATDVELSNKLIQNLSVSGLDAAKAIKNIAESPDFKNRFAADNLPKRHPFALIKNHQEDIFDELIWKAQLQVLFPLVEEERIALIKKYKAEIKEALNKQYYDDKKGEYRDVLQYGEIVTDPLDLELGTIYRMCYLKTDETMTDKLLTLAFKDKERLELLHSMRNAIAHADASKPSTVTGFFENYPYNWE